MTSIEAAWLVALVAIAVWSAWLAPDPDASPEAPPLRLTIESQPPLADAGKPCEASGIRIPLERVL